MWKRWIIGGQGMKQKVVKQGRREYSSKTKDFPTLKDHPAAQIHAEETVESQRRIQHSTEARLPAQSLKKEFQIYRWNPDLPNQKPFLRSYFVDLSSCGPMVSSYSIYIFFSNCNPLNFTLLYFFGFFACNIYI